MSSGLNDFFIETAVNQGWLSGDQVAAAHQTLAADPHLSVCDWLLQQGWLGQEHVDWLQQAALLQTSSSRLKSRAKKRDADSAPLTPGSSANLNAVLQAGLSAARLPGDWQAGGQAPAQAGLSAMPTAQAGLSAAPTAQADDQASPLDEPLAHDGASGGDSTIPDEFLLEAAAQQEWLSAEQIAAARAALADNPALTAADWLMQQGWLGQEHVDWLRQAAALRTTAHRLMRAPGSAGQPRKHSGLPQQAAEGVTPTPDAAAASALSIESLLVARDKPRYRGGAVVAKGGMGAIVEAADINLRRRVAMKVIRDQTQADREDFLRFIEEAQITGQLEHPNIVPIHELGINENGRVFYTMKFVKGVTLHAAVERIRAGDAAAIARHPLPHLLTVFQKVCDAMAFAHSRNVIHRDLKPENIMLGDYGEVLVMDWGLAKVLGNSPQSTVHRPQTADRGPSPMDYRPPTVVGSARADEGEAFQTMDGRILGTPHFMPPEQAEGRGDDVDARSDIYALGGILYNLLTLRLPVQGKTLNEVLGKISTGDIPPPTSYNPKSSKRVHSPHSMGGQHHKQPSTIDHRPSTIALPHCPGGRIPESLSAVTMKALSLRREDRYQTVAELQKDIEAYQGGFATSAEGAGMLRQMVLLLKRHKTTASLVASGLAIFLMLICVFLVRLSMEKNRALASEKRAKTNEAHALASEKEARDNLTRALTGEKMAKEEKEKAIAANADRLKALAEQAQAAEQAAKANDERAKAAEEAARASEEREKALQQATAAQAEAKKSADVAKASEAKVATMEKTALTQLGVVKETAPAFYDQARALVEDQQFEPALEKVSFAIKLAPQEAAYHVLKGNLLQSLLRIKEAKEAYEAALKCVGAAAGGDRSAPLAGGSRSATAPTGADGAAPSIQQLAAENLALCEKILKDNPGFASEGGRRSVGANSGGVDGACTLHTIFSA